MPDKPVSVLLIEDDLMVQEVNREFLDRVNGFEVIGIASNGAEGLELVRTLAPDLILIDMYMPKMNGLETIQAIRAEGHASDIIAITAASDMETVRNVLLHGAVDYLMKPFKFERLKQSLENYSAYRRKLKDKSRLTQKELDSIRFQKEEPEEKKDLPKGLHEVTLHKILTYLTDQSDPVSAENVASSVGIARVTARRYLEHLEREGKLEIDIQYGGVGRPVNKYLISGRA